MGEIRLVLHPVSQPLIERLRMEGTYHSLVFLSDGTVKSVGDHGDGQLGDNSIIDKKVFNPVSGLDLISTP